MFSSRGITVSRVKIELPCNFSSSSLFILADCQESVGTHRRGSCSLFVARPAALPHPSVLNRRGVSCALTSRARTDAAVLFYRATARFCARVLSRNDPMCFAGGHHRLITTIGPTVTRVFGQLSRSQLEHRRRRISTTFVGDSIRALTVDSPARWRFPAGELPGLRRTGNRNE